MDVIATDPVAFKGSRNGILVSMRVTATLSPHCSSSKSA